MFAWTIKLFFCFILILRATKTVTKRQKIEESESPHIPKVSKWKKEGKNFNFVHPTRSSGQWIAPNSLFHETITSVDTLVILCPYNRLQHRLDRSIFFYLFYYFFVLFHFNQTKLEERLFQNHSCKKNFNFVKDDFFTSIFSMALLYTRVQSHKFR